MKRIVFVYTIEESITSGTVSTRTTLHHSERLMKKANHIDHKSLISPGVCFGKFSKTLKFRLHVTCLDYISPYAKVADKISPSDACSTSSGSNQLLSYLSCTETMLLKPVWED